MIQQAELRDNPIVSIDQGAGNGNVLKETGELGETWCAASRRPT